MYLLDGNSGLGSSSALNHQIDFDWWEPTLYCKCYYFAPLIRCYIFVACCKTIEVIFRNLIWLCHKFFFGHFWFFLSLMTAFLSLVVISCFTTVFKKNWVTHELSLCFVCCFGYLFQVAWTLFCMVVEWSCLRALWFNWVMDWVVDGCLIQVYDRLLGADALSGSGDCVIADICSGLMIVLAVLLSPLPHIIWTF